MLCMFDIYNLFRDEIMSKWPVICTLHIMFGTIGPFWTNVSIEADHILSTTRFSVSHILLSGYKIQEKINWLNQKKFLGVNCICFLSPWHAFFIICEMFMLRVNYFRTCQGEKGIDDGNTHFRQTIHEIEIQK